MKQVKHIFLAFIIIANLIFTTSNVLAANVSEAQVNGAISWAKNANFSKGYYGGSFSGYCLAFCQLAYSSQGVTVGRWGNAQNAGNNLIINTDMNPPKGALVFFSNRNGSGHIGIALGDGTYIHAASDAIAITQLTSYNSTFAIQYRGWGYPGKGNTLPNTTSGNNGGGSTSGVNISEGTYSISPKNAQGLCLDISGGSSDPKANVQIWGSNGTNAQKFKITRSGSSYIITALSSNKVLDIQNGSSAPGANVWQYTSNGTAAQKWTFVDAGGGYYYIKSDLGTYLDVHNAGRTNGTNVQAWSFNGSDAQKWKLSSVSGNGTNVGNTRTGIVVNTGGQTLAINSVPKKGNQIGEIPEGARCTVYPNKSSGNWYWVEYNGVSGYSYNKYISLQ